ncbi:MAG: hypothetical protein ABIA76_02110 [Candidatus Diapherotrites archaeon]
MKKILFIALVSLILVLGCTTTPPAPQQNDQIPGTPNDQVPGTPNNNVPNNNPPTSQPDDPFDDFFNLMCNADEFRIDYQMSTNAGGQLMGYDYTHYRKGDLFRLDIDAESGKTKMYYLEDRMVMCSEYEGEEMCLEMQAGQDSQADEFDELTKVDKDAIMESRNNYSVTPLGARNVGGQMASCFKLTSSLSGEQIESEYCIANCLMVYIKVTSPQFTQELTATNYSTTVPDSDFVPPETTDFSEFYNMS